MDERALALEAEAAELAKFEEWKKREIEAENAGLLPPHPGALALSPLYQAHLQEADPFTELYRITAFLRRIRLTVVVSDEVSSRTWEMKPFGGDGLVRLSVHQRDHNPLGPRRGLFLRRERLSQTNPGVRYYSRVGPMLDFVKFASGPREAGTERAFWGLWANDLTAIVKEAWAALEQGNFLEERRHLEVLWKRVLDTNAIDLAAPLAPKAVQKLLDLPALPVLAERGRSEDLQLAFDATDGITPEVVSALAERARQNDRLRRQYLPGLQASADLFVRYLPEGFQILGPSEPDNPNARITWRVTNGSLVSEDGIGNRTVFASKTVPAADLEVDDQSWLRLATHYPLLAGALEHRLDVDAGDIEAVHHFANQLGLIPKPAVPTSELGAPLPRAQVQRARPSGPSLEIG